MCSIVVFNGVHPDHPVLIAANRDELYARPATAPQVLDIEPRVIGGRDERAAGTWMGATPDGLFVGLTNQRTWAPPDTALRSRGQVVLEALRQRTAAGIVRFLEDLDGREYNPFNLVFGSAGQMHLAYARTERRALEIAPLPAGIHVLPNERLDSDEFPKVRRLRRALAPYGNAPWTKLLPQLHEALADHDMPPMAQVAASEAGARFPPELVRKLHAVCIHTESYGTRSSTVVALGKGRTERYLFADGPPCQNDFVDVTDLLEPA